MLPKKRKVQADDFTGSIAREALAPAFHVLMKPSGSSMKIAHFLSPATRS